MENEIFVMEEEATPETPAEGGEEESTPAEEPASPMGLDGEGEEAGEETSAFMEEGDAGSQDAEAILEEGDGGGDSAAPEAIMTEEEGGDSDGDDN